MCCLWHTPAFNDDCVKSVTEFRFRMLPFGLVDMYPLFVLVNNSVASVLTMLCSAHGLYA